MSLQVRSRDRLRVRVGRGVGVRIGESRTVDFIQKSEKPNALGFASFASGSDMCKQYDVIRISDFGMIHPRAFFVIDEMHAWAFVRHRCFRAIDFA